MLVAPVFSELSFDGGFEDGGFVALEVGLDALEVGDGFVEAGELFFDFRDDSFLLIKRDQPDGYVTNVVQIEHRSAKTVAMIHDEFYLHEILSLDGNEETCQGLGPWADKRDGLTHVRFLYVILTSATFPTLAPVIVN